METAKAKSNIVLVGTYRPENESWIRERRLYNLPLPKILSHKEHKGRKDGRAAAPHAALPFHRNVSSVVLFAEGHPNFAFKAKFKDVVDGEWLAANGYIRDGRASARPHAAAYALYELLEESTPAKLLGRKSAEVFVSSSRCPVVKIDEAFYSRSYPVTGGKSMPYVFDCLKPYFRKWKSATTFDPMQELHVAASVLGNDASNGGIGVRGDDFIKSRILSLRGVQVMLDSDLAMLYGVETKVLNQAVKRNIERFPPDFMFQVTDAEWREAQDAVANLKSQFVTSSWGGVRKRPFAFTENGIAMLSGVLRSQTAIEINIRIMRVFVAIRRFAIANMGILQRLGAVEVKQAVMDEKLNAVLGQIKCREFPPERIFYDGHEYDAYDKIVEFIRKARRDIVVIDAYADNVVLQILGKKRTGVSVTVVKGPRARLTTLDVSKFNAQFANSLTVKTSPAFHDRFIIIDQSLLLHVGASLNYIGKKCFAISVLDAANIPSIMGRI